MLQERIECVGAINNGTHEMRSVQYIFIFCFALFRENAMISKDIFGQRRPGGCAQMAIYVRLKKINQHKGIRYGIGSKRKRAECTQ